MAASIADRLDFSHAELMKRTFVPEDLRLQEGRQEGRVEMLLELLEAHFGPLSGATMTRIRELDSEEIKRRGVRALTAACLDEIEL